MPNELQLDIATLAKICRSRDWTLGFAESCTGGLLSATLAAQPGVSAFYRGSIVSYAGGVKTDLLQVSAASMSAYGEVSIPVARAMARGARQALNCDWAVAITGIAGPSGGSKDKPVGTVCFAVTGPGFEEAIQRHMPGSERRAIQQQAAHFAFELLLSAMR